MIFFIFFGCFFFFINAGSGLKCYETKDFPKTLELNGEFDKSKLEERDCADGYTKCAKIDLRDADGNISKLRMGLRNSEFYQQDQLFRVDTQ